MKRFSLFVLSAMALAAVSTVNAENKNNAPVYDPMTWRADTIQGVAGYTIADNVKAKKHKKAKSGKNFLPMKDLATGEVLGKLQPVSLSDYNLGWNYVQTAPANTSMADNNQPKEEKKD